jgi:saccharopine dehydrogenase-like NADP-dependent oxidoreductase
MKTILLLLSSDRYSIPLIRYLVLEGKRYGWKTCIGSMFEHAFVDRIKEEKVSNDLIFINITDFRQCDHAIRKSDLVIGMMPDVMLLQVADFCITHGKTLVSPSRLNRQMHGKKSQAEENKVLLLLECGFTPGLDHITAKKAIDNIQSKGGNISSFKTYSGSLIAENSIDNPWEFKLTEPATDVINIGKGNNRHLINGQLQYVPYQQLFSRATPLQISGLKNVIAIPEEDALYCRKVYGLNETNTVVKGRIVRSGFERTWDILVKLGLTNTNVKIDMFEEKSFYHFLKSLLPYSASDSITESLSKNMHATFEDIQKLKWLGLFDDEWMDGYKDVTPAVILQHLLEKKFTMLPHEKDCIILRHEIEYTTKDYHHKFIATLIAQGEDERNSALAKAIGLTTGAAAKAVMLDNIKVKGLYTPVKKEVYDPILNELDDLGVAFHIEETKVHDEDWNVTVDQNAGKITT